MNCFDGVSADIVWQQALEELIYHPDYSHTGRNGKTLEILPCIFRVKDPRYRWILSRRPPFNPAFGLVEFIWIITGNNESQVLNFWNPGLPKYSGDGDTYYGAYGFRLRHEFGVDQIERAYDILSNTPETRQAVLQIWKPDIDMPSRDGQPASPDIPCNIMSLLKVRNGRLHWSQFMRSNDIMRGLPYNFIQFTMLQEIMAGWLECDLGEYFHHSDSLHIYEQDIEKFSCSPTESCNIERSNFSMPYDETQVLFANIYSDLANVAKGKLSRRQIRDIFTVASSGDRSNCTLIGDMMAVIGSDAARRYGFGDLSHELLGYCTDQGLRTAAQNWLSHMEGAE